MSYLNGCITALVTPFNFDKSIDYDSFTKLVNYQKDSGVDAVLVAGSTGESLSLSDDEIIELTKKAKELCSGSKTKIVGSIPSTYDTRRAVELTKKFEKLELDGLLAGTPAYVKANNDGLYQHFKNVAGVANCEVILYNIPSRTAKELESSLILKLVHDVQNINIVKDALNSVEKSLKLLYNDQRIDIFSASDKLNFSLVCHGAVGVISVVSNILPKETLSMLNHIKSSDLDEAKNIDQKLYRVNRLFELDTNPIVVKAMLYFMGLVDNLEYRLPLTPPSRESLITLENFCKNINI